MRSGLALVPALSGFVGNVFRGSGNDFAGGAGTSAAADSFAATSGCVEGFGAINSGASG